MAKGNGIARSRGSQRTGLISQALDLFSRSVSSSSYGLVSRLPNDEQWFHFQPFLYCSSKPSFFRHSSISPIRLCKQIFIFIFVSVNHYSPSSFHYTPFFSFMIDLVFSGLIDYSFFQSILFSFGTL